MQDIWDGEVLGAFLGPDGKPFWKQSASETRLVFGLAIDGFNPYQSKTAKQKVTSTAIYLICFDLPLHLRYLPENMYLVGVIPGPGKPSLEQINPFLELVVDDLLEFWSPGVWYSRTLQHSSRHLVRAALVPLICDILAARQVAGMGSHAFTYFCSFCYLKLEDIENLDKASWSVRTCEAHKECAQRWKDAPTVEAREKIFEESGVRWSELLRLPYWDPIRFTVVDSMHNLYLGLVKTHCRDVWGMQIDAEDGDAYSNPKKAPPPRPSAEEMSTGSSVLYSGSFSELSKCRKGVLWHLCQERDLRRAGTVKMLAKELDKWVGPSV